MTHSKRLHVDIIIIIINLNKEKKKESVFARQFTLFLRNLCSRNVISPSSESKQQVVNLYAVCQLFLVILETNVALQRWRRLILALGRRLQKKPKKCCCFVIISLLSQNCFLTTPPPPLSSCLSAHLRG